SRDVEGVLGRPDHQGSVRNCGRSLYHRGLVNGQGTSLKRYAITRIVLVIPMVFILLTFVFLLMRVAPGNAVSASLGGHAPPAVIKQISHQLGYDKPLYVQYGNYLWDILRGNFGQTISDRRPVQDVIRIN